MSKDLAPGQKYSYEITIEVDLRSMRPGYSTVISGSGKIVSGPGQTRDDIEQQAKEEAIARWRAVTGIKKGGLFTVEKFSLTEN